VCGVSVLSSFLQTMPHGVKAGLMTGATSIGYTPAWTKNWCGSTNGAWAVLLMVSVVSVSSTRAQTVVSGAGA